MQKLPIDMVVVDLTTGEERQETAEFDILPPSDPKACKVCGVQHEPGAPHNAQSLYYQYSFYGEHGRWPTWIDAMAHCSDEVKEITIEVLEKNGINWQGKN